MKRVLFFAAIFTVIYFFSGCEDNGRITVHYGKVTIASKEVLFPNKEGGPARYFTVAKYGDSKKWEQFGGMYGFVFEEGYECVAFYKDVREYLPGNSFGRDYITHRSMIKLVSKVKKDSENLPEDWKPVVYVER